MITVLGILVVLLLAGLWFSRFMTALRGQTQRLGDVRMTERLAQSLATLAAHKIQYELLGRNPNAPPSDGGIFRQCLAQPLDRFPDIEDAPLVLESGSSLYSRLAGSLLAPLRREGGFKVEVAYSLRRSDFSAAGWPFFPAEKRGYIRLTIRTHFRGRADEFQFACPIRITTAWIPLLSKFTLFIEDPETKTDPWRFNLISTTPDGERLPTGADQAQPIVLTNGEELTGGELMDEESFFRRKVGLVHFGKDPVVLNLARGESRRGRFGEGFHFFEIRNSGGEWDGLKTIFEAPYGGGTAGILQWDKGISDEAAAGWPADWYEFVANTPEARFMKTNSLFRLFGTDAGRKTPTLVLGQVYRSQISAMACQTEPHGLLPGAFLIYPKTLEEWAALLDPDPSHAAALGLESISTLALEVLQLTVSVEHRDLFRRLYATRATQIGYNASIAYISTNNAVANPFPKVVTSGSRDHLDRMQAATGVAVLEQLPRRLREIFPNPSDRMPGLAQTLNSSLADANRISWAVDLASCPAQEDPFLWALRQSASLAADHRTLTINGWVLLRNPLRMPVTISQPLKLAGQGGIILDHGSLTIGAPIDGSPTGDESSAPRFLLHLVALDGDITVQGLDGQRVDASLHTTGKVLFRRGRPHIHGGVVTGKFDLANASAGADLHYPPDLAALPGVFEEPTLVTFNLDPNPVFLR